MKGQIIELQKATGNVYLESISDFKTYYSARIVESDCIAISFINKGSNTVYINGLTLSQNESLDISQPNSFIDKSKYEISFASDGISSELVVIRILPLNQS